MSSDDLKKNSRMKDNKGKDGSGSESARKRRKIEKGVDSKNEPENSSNDSDNGSGMEVEGQKDKGKGRADSSDEQDKLTEEEVLEAEMQKILLKNQMTAPSFNALGDDRNDFLKEENVESVKKRGQLIAAAVRIERKMSAMQETPQVYKFQIGRKRFTTNGPIGRDDSKYKIVIPPEHEDIEVLVDAVKLKQFLIYHGPRQSGKTTKMYALRDWAYTNNIKCRVVLFEDIRNHSMEEFEYKSDDEIVLIDEFDLVYTRLEDQDTFLHNMRAGWQALADQNKISGKHACTICFGSYNALRAKTKDGSQFNNFKAIKVKPFTLLEVKTLFGEFATEYPDAKLEDGLVEEIYEASGGHRGFTTLAGSCLEEITRSSPGTVRFTLDYWNNNIRPKWLSKIQGTPLFERAMVSFTWISDTTGQTTQRLQEIITTITLQVHATAVDNWRAVFTDPLERVIVETLFDLAMLITDDGIAALIGPPAVQPLLPCLLVTKKLIPSVEVYRSEKKLLEFILQQCLPHVHGLFKAGAVKYRETEGKERVPSEECYTLTMAEIFYQLSNLLVVPQTRKDSKIPDFLVKFPGQSEFSIVEVLAHERSEIGKKNKKLTERPSSVQGHFRRMTKYYIPSHPKSPSAWIINIELDVMKNDRKSLSCTGVHVLHVFHDSNCNNISFAYHSAN